MHKPTLVAYEQVISLFLPNVSVIRHSSGMTAHLTHSKIHKLSDFAEHIYRHVLKYDYGIYRIARNFLSLLRIDINTVRAENTWALSPYTRNDIFFS